MIQSDDKIAMIRKNNEEGFKTEVYKILKEYFPFSTKKRIEDVVNQIHFLHDMYDVKLLCQLACAVGEGVEE